MERAVMDDRIIDSVELPRRAVRQPTPALSQGGDCGPCALGGLLQIDPGVVYDHCREPGVQSGITRYDVECVLNWAEGKQMVDRIVTAVPVWPAFSSAHGTWGYTGELLSQDWGRWLRMAFDAGYYGVTSVVYSGNGKPGDHTDHVVLLCGWRCHRVPHKTVEGAAKLNQEILVSCSSKHPEGRWYEVGDFLSRFGGYNVVLARPMVSQHD